MAPPTNPPAAPAPTLYRADYVFTGEGPALADGAVALGPGGVVVEVGPAAELLPRHAGAPCVRLSGLLAPGLVNAHTHLELSHLRGRAPGGGGFFDWVEGMMRARATAADDAEGAAIEAALGELVDAGCVAVGEVTNSLAAVPAMARANLGGAVFHEVFGLDRRVAEGRLAGLPAQRAGVVGAWPEGRLAYAPAPHSLYSLHPDLVRATLRAAREAGARTSMHLGEHPAEREFLARGTGPLVPYARRFGLPIEQAPVPGLSPVAYARELGALGPDVIVVHLTTATRDELDAVAAAGSPVVFCPRSNAHIEGLVPPLAEALAAGLEPALGTDSLASNDSLDVLAEAAALARAFPGVAPALLWSMATAFGADALGRPDLGRLRPGASPGLVLHEGVAPAGADPLLYFLHQGPARRRWAHPRPAQVSP
ncbi:MAG TPA: amidohydrolase family protein [Polyangiaceae bacterium]|nr:amidohydrolase family protein [Polyangiaceae bacterium]